MEMISILLSRLMMYELAAAGAFDKRLSIATSGFRVKEGDARTCCRQAADDARWSGARSISDADNMAPFPGET